MKQQSPTFQFWDTVLRLEKLILIFVRSHHENNFDLYIEVLEALVGFFFILDHYNYARWIPIHINHYQLLFKQNFKNIGLFQKPKEGFHVCRLTSHMSKRTPK